MKKSKGNGSMGGVKKREAKAGTRQKIEKIFGTNRNLGGLVIQAFSNLRPAELLPFETLSQACWGIPNVSGGTVDVALSRVNKQLAKTQAGYRIATARGYGFVKVRVKERGMK